MAKVADHKCPNCNAHLHFSPKQQDWECEYCGSIFKLEDLKNNEENYEEIEVPTKKEVEAKKKEEDSIQKEFAQEMDLYNCPNCGASIITDHNTSSTFCVYCKSTAILKDKLTGAYAPSRVIPFHKTKEEAIVAFKKIAGSKFLAPKEFKEEKNIQEITGIYIPFWLFDCTSSGQINATATRITTWKNRTHIFTKTDTFQVKRGGDFKFIKIPVDGSIRFKDEIMNSIEPYDYKELKDFSHSYLSGFLSEKYDVDQYKAYDSAKQRALQTAENHLNGQIQGYTTKIVNSKAININSDRIDYVLLPVWMLNIKYNDKMYTFAMNGQTGKMVGDIPYSKKKAFLTWLVITIILVLIFAVATYYGVIL